MSFPPTDNAVNFANENEPVTYKYSTRLKGIAKDKHFSLFADR
jgi:hypothetical protein